MGASLEYGTGGKYFGLAVVGASYLTNVERFDLGVGFAPDSSRETSRGNVGPTQIRSARIHMVTIRALQPQFRFAAWRFLFQVQLGFELRTGQILEPGNTFYKDGFMLLDLQAAGRLNVRYFIFEGLYFYASGNFTRYLLGTAAVAEAPVDDQDPPMPTGPQPRYTNWHQWGFNVGFGYGF